MLARRFVCCYRGDRAVASYWSIHISKFRPGNYAQHDTLTIGDPIDMQVTQLREVGGDSSLPRAPVMLHNDLRGRFVDDQFLFEQDLHEAARTRDLLHNRDHRWKKLR